MFLNFCWTFPNSKNFSSFLYSQHILRSFIACILSRGMHYQTIYIFKKLLYILCKYIVYHYCEVAPALNERIECDGTFPGINASQCYALSISCCWDSSISEKPCYIGNVQCSDFVQIGYNLK